VTTGTTTPLHVVAHDLDREYLVNGNCRARLDPELLVDVRRRSDGERIPAHELAALHLEHGGQPADRQDRGNWTAPVQVAVPLADAESLEDTGPMLRVLRACALRRAMAVRLAIDEWGQWSALWSPTHRPGVWRLDHAGHQGTHVGGNHGVGARWQVAANPGGFVEMLEVGIDADEDALQALARMRSDLAAKTGRPLTTAMIDAATTAAVDAIRQARG
jgi:hypothetical protein